MIPFRDLVINQLDRLADQSQPSQRINSSHPRSELAQGGSETGMRNKLLDDGRSWG